MLVACPACKRQFRFTHRPAGGRIRCRCGHAFRIPKPQPRDAEMLHCANCGAPLAPDARACGYCGGAVHPVAARNRDLCPRCFARLPEGAHYCTTCGSAIRPETIDSGVLTGHPCPRDGTKLVAKTLDDLPVEECPTCLGLWIDQPTFRDLCERKRSEYAGNPLPAAPPPNPLGDPVVYLKCPVCGNLMNRQNYGKRSGVIIDRCTAHGIWLDDQELERIARFIAEGGLARARAAEAERAQAEARAAAYLRSAAPARPIFASGGGDARPTGIFGFLADLFLE